MICDACKHKDSCLENMRSLGIPWVHIDGCKTFEAKQKTAKWSDSSNGWMCSSCNCDSSFAYAVCPKCGCKMRNGYVPYEVKNPQDVVVTPDRAVELLQRMLRGFQGSLYTDSEVEIKKTFEMAIDAIQRERVNSETDAMRAYRWGYMQAVKDMTRCEDET